MLASSEFGFEQLISELLRGLADAVADRPAESEAQRFARHRTAVFSVMAFHPRDAMETVLAGQCVMFDHLLRDAAHDLLRNETGPGKLRIRSQITALGRLFLKHLEHWCQLRARPETVALPRSGPDPVPNPAQMPEPVRQSANVAAASPAETEPVTAETEPAFAASAPGKAERLLQRGFQNRRARRALQFRKPPGKSSSRRSDDIAVAAKSTVSSGL